VGAIVIALSFLFALYAIYAEIWLHSPRGFTALAVVITFLSGVNLFFPGVIGECVGREYDETKAGPHCVVRKVVGHGIQREAETEMEAHARLP